MVEYHPSSPKDQMRIHQFGRKVLPDLEEKEMMDASDIYPRRIKAKEVLISQKDGESVFPFADGNAKLSGRDCEFRVLPPRQEQLVRSEDLSGEISGESEESQPTEPIDDAEARCDFGRSAVTSSIVITLNHEYYSMCRRKKHSLFH